MTVSQIAAKAREDGTCSVRVQGARVSVYQEGARVPRWRVAVSLSGMEQRGEEWTAMVACVAACDAIVRGLAVLGIFDGAEVGS